jgi:pimeloyl-ACP methyl ester carboxylesterase
VLLCPASARAMLDAIERDEDDDAQRDTEAPDDDSTESAASHGDGMTRWDMPRLRAYFERQDTRSLAARVRCPVLVVHPRGDEIVPLSHSLTLVEHLPAETTLLALEGGSHFSAQHDPAIHAYTLAWLTEEVSRLLGGSVW